MPSDPKTSKRVRHLLVKQAQAEKLPALEERFFFGGDAWFFQGHFVIGIYNDQLTIRIGPQQAAIALTQTYVHPMDITGKPMKGWVFVEPPGFQTTTQLKNWLKQACDFVQTLPAKR